MPLQRYLPRTREHSSRANPLYGYGYAPNWPSIMSIAHDEEDGGRLFMIMDRPCVLLTPDPLPIPLEIVGTGLSVVAAEMVLPFKCRLAMDGPVAAGAAWRWPGNNSHLYDPTTGIGPNAGAGYCADYPGPYVPPPPAVVVATAFSGGSCTLTFDRVVTLVGGAVPDDAILFDGAVAATVNQVDAFTLGFTVPGSLSPGSTWVIGRQPAWITNEVAWSENGVF